MAKGAIIIPAGLTIPAKWWTLKISRANPIEPGARFIIRGADPYRRATLAVLTSEGLLNLINQSDTPISMEIENLVIKAGRGGVALRLSGPDHVRLSNVQIDGGKNGVFAPTHPLDLEMNDCEVMHCADGSGYTHNVYLNYTRNVKIRDCRFHSPRAQGHVFKGYAQHIDVRNSYFSHYETEHDLRQGFYGELPVFDRGGWGSTIAIGNTFVRRGPARRVAVEIRNRGFPPGYSKYVRPDWGTREVDYHDVDNRDPTNPHLFKHLFFGNEIINGLLPNQTLDPSITRNPGTFIRNNGSAPWSVQLPGKPENRPKPDDWQPHHERAVVYLGKNKVKGVAFREFADPVPYKEPDVKTPIRGLNELPGWAKDWIKT